MLLLEYTQLDTRANVGDIMDFCKFLENAFVLLECGFSRQQVWRVEAIVVTHTAMGNINSMAMK